LWLVSLAIYIVFAVTNGTLPRRVVAGEITSFAQASAAALWLPVVGSRFVDGANMPGDAHQDFSR
jgi:hypothetical protein